MYDLAAGTLPDENVIGDDLSAVQKAAGGRASSADSAELLTDPPVSSLSALQPKSCHTLAHALLVLWQYSLWCNGLISLVCIMLATQGKTMMISDGQQE